MQQQSSVTWTPRHTVWRRWPLALGVVVAGLGGFVADRFVAYGSTMQSFSLFYLIIGLASISSALMWRTWRALLILPLALWLGIVAADVVYRALDHYAFSAVWGAPIVLALDMLVVAALPAVLGAAIGTVIGIWLEQRLRQ